MSKSLFASSQAEWRNLRTLTLTAMLIALKIVLDALNVRVNLSPDLRITFGFLAYAMIGMLFGPSVAITAGAAGDILGYLVNTGGAAYFPGYTITAMLAGLVWGVALYKRPVSLWRALAAKAFINIFLNIGLNTFWNILFFGRGSIATIPMRIIKNLFMLPIEALLLVAVAKIVLNIYQRAFSSPLTIE